MRLPSVPGPREVLALVDRGGEALEQLLGAVPRITAVLADAEGLIGDVRSLVQRIEGTRITAETTISRIDGTVGRVTGLVDRLEPSLTTLQPTLDRLAETTAPHEVDALVGLVDQLPALLTRMEQDVLPVLGTLTTVAPDLHDLLDVSRELNELLGKLPGMGRIKKKVEEQQAEDAAG